MSKRLASFAGPSTPNSSPIKPNAKSPTPKSTPSSRQQPAESPFHRKLRSTLIDIRQVCDIWTDLVLKDGLDAAKALVDTRTDLTNTLSLYRDSTLPPIPIVTPRLQKMDKYSEELQNVIGKLRKCFNRLVGLVDSLEPLYQDAVKQRGFLWTTEPMWFTWSLASFVDRVPLIVKHYHRALYHYTNLITVLDNDKLPFDKARDAIQQWATQPDINTGGWSVEWEEICQIEVGRWDDRSH